MTPGTLEDIWDLVTLMYKIYKGGEAIGQNLSLSGSRVNCNHVPGSLPGSLMG